MQQDASRDISTYFPEGIKRRRPRNFRQQLGITPKTYMNTIRFLHAYFSAGSRQTNLTHVALEHGYYDQNHFIKDFRKHTGKPPSLG